MTRPRARVGTTLWALAAAIVILASAASSHGQTIATLSIPNRDLVYVPQTNRVYVSVPSTGGVYANSVVAIDPATGAVVGSCYVGSEPSRLAASADGARLYVGLDGAGAIRVVDLATFLPGAQFSLGRIDLYCSVSTVEDLAVQPGHAGVLAVALGCGGSSGNQGIAIYDNGVRRANVVAGPYDYRTVTFGGSASVLYSADTYTTAATFSRLLVDGSGVTLVDQFDDLIDGWADDIRYFGGTVYNGNQLLNPEIPSPAGRLPVAGYVSTADLTRGLAFLLGDHPTVSDRKAITAFDSTTLVPLWSVEIASQYSVYSDSTLVQTTANRFAFRTSSDVVLVDATAAAATPTYRLRVDKNGSGTGTVTSSVGALACGNACNLDYTAGMTVVLTPTPGAGSQFDGWTGDDDCADGTVTMSGPRTCVATFTRTTGGPNVRRIALKAGHLLYDPVSQLLYATLPGSNGAGGNSVITIGPSTGAVGTPQWIGSEPSKLALSDDHQFLYVGLDGESSIARVNLSAGAVDLRFPLLGDYSCPNVNALGVQPGNANLVVVGRRGSSSGGYTAAYEGGVSKPDVLTWSQAEPAFDFGAAASTLYARDYGGSRLLTIGLDSAGLRILSTASLSLGGTPSFAGSRLYGSTGKIVDPAAAVQVGQLQVGSSYGLAVDAARNEAVALASKDSSTARLTVFDLATMVPRWSVDVPLDGSSTSTLKFPVRLTATVFAFVADAAIFIVDAGAGAAVQYQLRVDKYGSGAGSVSASDVGISCGTSCRTSVPAATVVTLTPVADTGSTFAGWAGDEDCVDGVVTMTSARSCTAVFDANTPTDATVRRVALRANDLVFDAASGLLLASLASSNGTIGNSIVSIDPRTGQVGSATWVGSEPAKLALSSDGGSLYIGLDGALAVARMRLPSRSVDLRFAVSTPPTAMRVQPGNPNVVLTSFSSYYAPLTAYDGGVARANTVSYIGPFDFGADPAVVYGADSGTLKTMSLSATGLVTTASFSSALSSSTLLEYEGGAVYEAAGYAVNPQNGKRLGLFAGAGSGSLFVLDGSSNTAFYLNAKSGSSSVKTLVAYDTTTFLPRWSVDVDLGFSPSTLRSLVRWGPAGFAFMADEVLYILEIGAPAQQKLRLRIDMAGTGTGTVTAAAVGITCGPTCAADVRRGTEVTLAATAGSGSAFEGWTGPDDCLDGVVTVTGPLACTAVFGATGAAAPSTRRIALRASDLVWDPLAGRLLAALPGDNGPGGNSIVSIDPTTGEVGAPWWIGSEPGKMALSSDSSTLYVANSGSVSVARARLATGSIDLRFPVPAAPTQLRVQPGQNGVLVANFASGSLTSYDNGLPRPSAVSSIAAFDFGASGSLIHANRSGSLATVSLSASGLQVTGSIPSVFDSFYDGLDVDGGRIYVPSGAVIDPVSGSRLGTFRGLSSSSLLAPESASSSAYFLTSNSNPAKRTLTVFDTATFVERWAAPVPLGEPVYYSAGVTSLVRWGTSGVAFLTSSAIIISDYAGLPTSSPLWVTKAGTGVGTVRTASGIDCGTTCSSLLPHGTSVAMVAIPSAPWVFAGWTGSADCTDGVVTIVPGGVSCVATFGPNPLSFTDDPLVARVTRVKAAHVVELRQRIDDLRARYSLPAASWTDATIEPGVTNVKREHLVEMRTAIAEVYAAAGRPAPWFSRPTIAAGQSTVTTADIQELRAAVGGIW